MDGASADKEVIIDLNKYLPENVELADSNSKIHVTLKGRTFRDPGPLS